jgi:hypothetical protein
MLRRFSSLSDDPCKTCKPIIPFDAISSPSLDSCQQSLHCQRLSLLPRTNDKYWEERCLGRQFRKGKCASCRPDLIKSETFIKIALEILEVGRRHDCAERIQRWLVDMSRNRYCSRMRDWQPWFAYKNCSNLSWRFRGLCRTLNSVWC